MLWPLAQGFRWQALGLVLVHRVLSVKTAAEQVPRWRQAWRGLWLLRCCPLLLVLLSVGCCAVARLDGRPWLILWRRSRPQAHRQRWGRRPADVLRVLLNRCLPRCRAVLGSWVSLPTSRPTTWQRRYSNWQMN